MIDVEVWKPCPIEQGQCLEAQIGPLLIRLRKSGDEIHIAAENNKDYQDSTKAEGFRVVSEQDAADLDWNRWVCGDQCNTVRLAPVMPDRPVVVRPELAVKIPSGRKALFFVGIPIWVRITAGEGGEIELCEEPSVDLSNIWFGDSMSGELGYSLRSRARRDISEIQAEPHRALCPVTIRNTSNEQVKIERFCVHVEHLTVYPGRSRLWTNGVQIAFRGEAEVSQLEYSEKPPAYEEVGNVLSPPRTLVRTTLLKRSLGGFGLFGAA
jgi:hypothetical protein